MSQYLGISGQILGRLTGTVLCAKGSKGESTEKPAFGSCVNIGLNLKFTKKNEEVPGYTKLTSDGWLYSEKTQEVIEQYLEK